MGAQGSQEGETGTGVKRRLGETGPAGKSQRNKAARVPGHVRAQRVLPALLSALPLGSARECSEQSLRSQGRGLFPTHGAIGDPAESPGPLTEWHGLRQVVSLVPRLSAESKGRWLCLVTCDLWQDS